MVNRCFTYLIPPLLLSDWKDVLPLEEIAVTVLRGYSVMRKRERPFEAAKLAKLEQTEQEEQAEQAEQTDQSDVKENRSFTKKQRAILKTWFREHENDPDGPRPTLEEKDELSAATSLTLTQLNNWFSNQRRRHWKR